MVSSTFTGLEKHRAALIAAIKGEGLTDVAMENDSAKPGVDLIASSLQMVGDAAAYVGVISRKYGQTPPCPIRNPKRLSLTELEFNEAQRLGRPILLFVMGEDHPVREADVETDPAKRKKLEAFRARAKRMADDDSAVDRVYATFENLDEFTRQAIRSVASLRQYLNDGDQPKAATEGDLIPSPPAFYAEPPYIGSHDFVGRQAELDAISDWAAPAETHPVLLFDAIGGSGKSMLTWHWTVQYATRTRGDWAGCFWYSFYERGALMSDFCRRALAYITGQPLSVDRKTRTPELGELLLRHLRKRPWLMVLDGLERILVAYHRYDAAQVPDENVNRFTDQIAQRDPCSAIRPEDDDLLRSLTAAAPSKLLITTRIVPRVLLNPAGRPIPGVRRVSLPGLQPADAETLLRSCGIAGSSQAIQAYLIEHCDCHPLVTGIVAGLINDYLPCPGDFDAWAADGAGGGRLDLADLDLVQKRNHILKAAISALPNGSRRLLSSLALISEAVDYPTLSALNPHQPAESEKVELPASPELTRALGESVRDLRRRGLLQFDNQTNRYDLHPVVRGVAIGGLAREEKERCGQRVVDHFSRQAHRPYKYAETLDELRAGLHVVRALVKMERYQRACEVFREGLESALISNLEAYVETLSLLRPFFPKGWSRLATTVEATDGANLASAAAVALQRLGESEDALSVFNATFRFWFHSADWRGALSSLVNMAYLYVEQNRIARASCCASSALELAELKDDPEQLFRARLLMADLLALVGSWEDAEAMWRLLNPMGQGWDRAAYAGVAEAVYASFRFRQGTLTEEHLGIAEQLARAGNDRYLIRAVCRIRGLWHIDQSRWAAAVDSLQDSVRLARAVGNNDASAETALALAKFRLGQLAEPQHQAERLACAREPSHRRLAELWFAIGDREQARKHALAAYKWAWADGEPHIDRYALNKARALLEDLREDIPKLPPYDPSREPKLPWADDHNAAIARLRTSKTAPRAVPWRPDVYR